MQLQPLPGETEEEYRLRVQTARANAIRSQNQQQAMNAAKNIPYAKEAAAMYGLVKGGNELGIGARDQGRFYKKIMKELEELF